MSYHGETQSGGFLTEPTMNDRRFGVLDLMLFLAILLLAASLRLTYLQIHCQQATSDGPYAVQDDWKMERESLVAALREGRGFVTRAPLSAEEEPTAHRAMGYPWLVSLADGSRLGMSNEQLVRWVQCLLGTLTAGLYFLFARRAFQSLLVATLAGVLCAVHPLWVFNTAELNDGVLASFLLGLSLFLGARAGQSGGPLTSLVFGLTLAGLSCARATMLPFAVVAMLWFLIRCRTLPRGWLFAVLAFLGFVNGLIPWTARNYQTFRTAVPIADSAYLHLWIGNNPQATGGPMTDAAIADAHSKVQRDEKSRLQQLQVLAQPERYSELAQDVADEVRGNPAAAMELRLRAAIGYFFGANWLNHQTLVRVTEPPPEEPLGGFLAGVPRYVPGALFAILVLAALGWRWSFAWRRHAMPSSLAMMWAPLPFILSHAESFHGPRLPLDGLLLTYAALAAVCLIPVVGTPLLRGEEYDSSN
jgi:hypothetical protein